MIKVGVLISGQPRSWEKGYEYLERNLLSLPNVETKIYIHTWKYDFVDYGKLISLYKPAAITIQEELSDLVVLPYTVNMKENQQLIYVDHPAKFTMSAFYSIYKALKLSEETYFNWMIKTRFDYAMNAPIPFDRLEHGKLYVPNCRLSPNRDFCNDQFAYGDQDVICRYCGTFQWLNRFYKQGVLMNGEDMLAANLDFEGLTGENMIYVNPRNAFPPGQYNGTPHNLIRDDIDLWLPKKI